MTANNRATAALARRISVASVVAGIAVFTAGCDFSAGSTAISKPSDVTAGNCLTIDGGTGGGKVNASTSSCDAEGKLTFYAAETTSMSGSCSGSNSAYIAFSNEKLCITPNFVPSSCYQIPTNGGRLVDYRKIDCDSSAAPSTVIATLATRGAADISCTDEQTKWKFAQPTSIGYCLKEMVA